jgi:hypothetical protein
MSLTEEEEEIIDWLDSIEEYEIPWSKFENKVKEVLDLDEDDDINESEKFSFNLIGVTISIEDGEEMYPVRDLRDGIVRGYSRD